MSTIPYKHARQIFDDNTIVKTDHSFKTSFYYGKFDLLKLLELLDCLILICPDFTKNDLRELFFLQDSIFRLFYFEVIKLGKNGGDICLNQEFVDLLSYVFYDVYCGRPRFGTSKEYINTMDYDLIQFALDKTSPNQNPAQEKSPNQNPKSLVSAQP